MRNQLQQMLRSLCFNNGWKYAVLWKLNHQTRTMFTWEDAYYESEHTDEKGCSGISYSSNGRSSHRSLELAVEKMSKQMYFLGEGLIGQVADSGKHSWIYSDEHVDDSSLKFEYFSWWKDQFSAGVKTIAVVSVIPYGVVQLGSFHKIDEDIKLVNHIRNVFSERLDSIAESIPGSVQPDMHPRFPDSAGIYDYMMKSDSSSQKDEMNWWPRLFSSVGRNCTPPFPSEFSSVGRNCTPPFPSEGLFLNQTMKLKNCERAECSSTVNEFSQLSSSENILGEETNVFSDSGKRSMGFSSLRTVRDNKYNLCNEAPLPNGSQMVTSNHPSEVLDIKKFQDPGEFLVPESPNYKLHLDFEKSIELQNNSNSFETNFSPDSFLAGYELFEALGFSFQEQNAVLREVEQTYSDMAIQISEGMGSRCLMAENPDVHLLDKLVANINHSEDESKSAESCCDTEESRLPADKSPSTTVGSMSSTCYSFDPATSNSLNSVTCGVESLKGFLSPSSSRGSENMDRPQEPSKISKKRTKTAENCRPRPRDRQLIQDRITLLRELVPSGTKY